MRVYDDDIYDVTFFVACYNEEENVISAIEAVPAACLEAGCTFDIVIVDDSSTDASVRLIREYMGRFPNLPITLVVNQANQGLAQLCRGMLLRPRKILSPYLRRCGGAKGIVGRRTETSGRG